MTTKQLTQRIQVCALTEGTCSQVLRYELYKGDALCFIEIYSLPVRGMFKAIVLHDAPEYNGYSLSVLYGDLATVNEHAEKIFTQHESQGYNWPSSTYCGQAIN